MAKKQEHNGRRLIIGSALFGVFGYVAGILTAPKSGQETRGEIADKAEDIKIETVAQLETLEDDLSALLKRTKSKTIALSAQAREEFNEAVIAAKDAENKASYVLKAVKAGEADNPELNKAIKQAKQAKKNLGKYLKS